MVTHEFTAALSALRARDPLHDIYRREYARRTMLSAYRGKEFTSRAFFGAALARCEHLSKCLLDKDGTQGMSKLPTVHSDSKARHYSSSRTTSYSLRH